MQCVREHCLTFTYVKMTAGPSEIITEMPSGAGSNLNMKIQGHVSSVKPSDRENTRYVLS